MGRSAGSRAAIGREGRNWWRCFGCANGEQTMNNRGLVLMSVLWVVLVVSFVSFALAAAVRAELASAGNSFDSERALYMARSAAEVIFLNLQKPDTLRDSPIKQEN